MPTPVRLNELGALKASDRSRILKRLEDESFGKPNGQVDSAWAHVRMFEQRYEVKSEMLGAKLASGAMKETNEIANWLYYLKIISLSER